MSPQMSTAMMSAPSSARRMAWARPWPRGFERAGQADVLALVAEIGQRSVLVVGPLVDRVEQVVVGAGAGGVVLTARPDRRGPRWPPVGCGDDLDVPAVMVVLSLPPLIHPRGGAGSLGPVGADQRVVEVDVGVPGRWCGQQRTVQPGCHGGQDVDPLV